MALIVDKKLFGKGLMLMASFLVVFVGIFVPIFADGKGGKMNGLEFSDDFFNKLSKGSSNFYKEIEPAVEKTKGVALDLVLKPKPGAKEADVKLLLENGAAAAKKAGLDVVPGDKVLNVKGDLGAFLTRVMKDSKSLYENDGKSVADFYGMGHVEAGKALWDVLAKLELAMQQKGMVEPAVTVNKVTKKILEPAFNFYGIKAEKVSENIFLLVALLVFYVVYTMWYGYAIFDMFGGIGLSMKKSKVKKEV